MAQITADMLKEKFGITVKSTFVPWSQSRFKDEKYQSLNWKITLCKGDREILTTDYMAGTGHCPAVKLDKLPMGCHIPLKNYKADAIKYECETGRTAKHAWGGNFRPGEPILPDVPGVVYCLLSDADAIDYPTFEDWAANFGYDEDSRKGEAVYRACLETGLKLRGHLGETVLAELRELFQDF